MELLFWDKRRIARLGFLVGRGYTAKEIAADLQTTPDAIYKQTCLMGLSLRYVKTISNLDRYYCINYAARLRNISEEDLLIRLITILNDESNLIDNILDDGINSQVDAKKCA